MGYTYVALTILFTVYGQIILKWRIMKYGSLPEGGLDKIVTLLKMLYDPLIISAFLSAFLASLAWMAAMTKLELSHAYPFMSLAFVLVLILSGVFFHETITTPKIAGITLIVLGIIVGSQS